ncbi:MAG: hypothetical protein D6730_00065 [Bacteroidetes bacterium]|nr:MAG: hypothetical protein D6730_00065 [Bacteroidota bacterium]
MTHHFFFLICALLALQPLQAQEIRPGQLADAGIEIQAYPTGIIPGLRFALALGPQDALHLRLGYNFIRHRDLGVHQDERGDGWGFSLGYRHYFSKGLQGWFLGLRDDTWFNQLDWRDNIDQADEVSGSTRIIVVQPTAEGGYLFESGNGKWGFAPSVAFGFEINVKTEGAEVGQGAILLIGIGFSRRGK